MSVEKTWMKEKGSKVIKKCFKEDRWVLEGEKLSRYGKKIALVSPAHSAEKLGNRFSKWQRSMEFGPYFGNKGHFFKSRNYAKEIKCF